MGPEMGGEVECRELRMASLPFANNKNAVTVYNVVSALNGNPEEKLKS